MICRYKNRQRQYYVGNKKGSIGKITFIHFAWHYIMTNHSSEPLLLFSMSVSMFFSASSITELPTRAPKTVAFCGLRRCLTNFNTSCTSDGFSFVTDCLGARANSDAFCR